MWSWRVVLLVLPLSGCVLAQEAPPPSDPPLPWSQPTGLPWSALTTGCGFCSGDPQAPEVNTVLVYPSGHVLWFTFGSQGKHAGGPMIRFSSGLSTYEDTLRDIIPRLDNGYVGGNLTVHSVRAGIVPSDDWSRIRPTFQEAVEEAEDPGPADVSQCSDAPTMPVQLLGTKDLAVELSTDHCGRANYHKGDPWSDIVDTSIGLREWLL